MESYRTFIKPAVWLLIAHQTRSNRRVLRQLWISRLRNPISTSTTLHPIAITTPLHILRARHFKQRSPLSLLLNSHLIQSLHRTHLIQSLCRPTSAPKMARDVTLYPSRPHGSPRHIERDRLHAQAEVKFSCSGLIDSMIKLISFN